MLPGRLCAAPIAGLIVTLIVTLAASTAAAAPPSVPASASSPASVPASARSPKPFGKGTVVPRLGLGVGFGDDLTSVSWVVGAGYFVVDGLEIGGRVGGTHLIWDPALRAELPGIADELPGTLMEITPLLRYVFFRSPYFSPYAFAGVGPTFLTNNAPAPVIGHWTAGPGVAIGLGPHVFLDISVSFSGRMPGPTCEQAFTDVFETAEGPTQFSLSGLCGWRWNPGIGLGVMF